MLRNILSVIGAIAVIGLIVMGVKFGGMASKVSTLDPAAMGEYMGMFGRVLETGNSADAMVRKVKINDDISTEDAIEAMNALAEENNFLVVGDAKMNIESSLKKTGNKDDANFITHISGTLKSTGETIFDMSTSQFLSKNPIFKFKFKGGKKGDKVLMTWVDRKGNTGKGKGKIK